MVKLFIGLGVLIFVAGAVAVGLGLPYVVLERGFTQVIVGTVGMNAGLVLIGIGVVLGEIRKGRLSVAATTHALAVDAPEAGTGSVAPLATAAAAGAAAAGLAVAASTSTEAAADKLNQHEFDWSKLDMPAAPAEPTLNLPKFELPPLDLPKPDLPNLDLPNLDLPKLGLPAVDETPLVDATSVSSEMPGQDEFTRLRAALSDQLERPDSMASEVADLPETAPFSEVNEDEDEAEAEQPMSTEGFEAHSAKAESAPDDVAEAESATTQPDVLDDPEPEISEAETEVPEAEAPTPAREVVSDEGVVRAYQVGDTAFTVYGDGTIRAETREGEYTFQSMEEVRAFLVQEKLKVRS